MTIDELLGVAGRLLITERVAGMRYPFDRRFEIQLLLLPTGVNDDDRNQVAGELWRELSWQTPVGVIVDPRCATCTECGSSRLISCVDEWAEVGFGCSECGGMFDENVLTEGWIKVVGCDARAVQG